MGEPALLDITRAVLVAAFLGAISVASGGAALAQNLDQGKSAPKLFAGLRVMSSQRARSGQGPLQPHAVPVPAGSLREQFELGLGAHLLSGVRRQCTARPVAGRRGEGLASCNQPIALVAAAARAGAGALGPVGCEVRIGEAPA